MNLHCSFSRIQAEKQQNTSTFSLQLHEQCNCFIIYYTSSVTQPRMVTQNKTLSFYKRVKWIIIMYGGIPQQVLGSFT